MPKLPKVSGDKAIKTLERLGFIRVRQKGSHVVMRKDTPKGTFGCVIPLHGEIAVGTLNSILKQAKVTPEEFINNL